MDRGAGYRAQEEFLDRYLNAEDVWAERRTRKKATGIRGSLAALMKDMQAEAEAPIEPYEGETEETVKKERRLSKRTVVSLLVLCLLTPLTILFGITFLEDRK